MAVKKNGCYLFALALQLLIPRAVSAGAPFSPSIMSDRWITHRAGSVLEAVTKVTLDGQTAVTLITADDAKLQSELIAEFIRGLNRDQNSRLFQVLLTDLLCVKCFASYNLRPLCKALIEERYFQRNIGPSLSDTPPGPTPSNPSPRHALLIMGKLVLFLSQGAKTVRLQYQSQTSNIIDLHQSPAAASELITNCLKSYIEWSRLIPKCLGCGHNYKLPDDISLPEV